MLVPKNPSLKTAFAQVCPPILLPLARRMYRAIRPSRDHSALSPHAQDLGVYWDPEMERVLETWGIGNVWDEIQLLMVGRSGRVLDIACGTGKTIEILARFRDIEIYGCDISDRLLGRAKLRGIDSGRLYLGDATQLPYADRDFDYAYSIGSLEHFTEEGIDKFLSECGRVTRVASFHQHPVSRTGKDEGWTKTVQSYFNNSAKWWLDRYLKVYETVYVLDSKWEDAMSVGKWFVCLNPSPGSEEP